MATKNSGQQNPAGRPSSDSDQSSSDSDRLSYEEARDQLADLVRRLEAGGLTLEQSLDLWERGERLASICEEWLEGARARLAAVTGRPSGDTPSGDGTASSDAPF